MWTLVRTSNKSHADIRRWRVFGIRQRRSRCKRTCFNTKPTAKPTAKPTDNPQSTGAPATSAPNATNAPNSPKRPIEHRRTKPYHGRRDIRAVSSRTLGLGAGILSKSVSNSVLMMRNGATPVFVCSLKWVLDLTKTSQLLPKRKGAYRPLMFCNSASLANRFRIQLQYQRQVVQIQVCKRLSELVKRSYQAELDKVHA